MRGILLVLSQGCKWRAIDRPEASWNSIYQYYRRWVRQGVFTEIFSQIELPLQGSRFFLDSTHVKVHRCASHPAGGPAAQAMGTTRGGRNTKIHAVVDGAGKPVRLLLSAGQEADITQAETLVEEIPATMLVADKGCDSDAFCQWLLERGSKACLPPRANRPQKRSYRKPSYRKHHLVENFFERIKNFRHVATRYDKLADTFLGFVCLAATIVLLRSWVCKQALVLKPSAFLVRRLSQQTKTSRTETFSLQARLSTLPTTNLSARRARVTQTI